MRRAPGRDLSVLMELQLSLEHHFLNHGVDAEVQEVLLPLVRRGIP